MEGTSILLGNLTISAFEEKVNLKFNEKDKKWLEEHRQSSANNIGDSEFHIFDMPTRILCGKDIYDEMLNMISSYDLRNVKQFGFQKNNK